MGFNRDLLTQAKIAEYPLLDGYDVDTLYQKAIMMQRQVISDGIWFLISVCIYQTIIFVGVL
jgi:hypothetical protein